MTLLEPPESKIKAAVKFHYDGASTVKKANLDRASLTCVGGQGGHQKEGTIEMDEGFFLWETNLILFHHLRCLSIQKNHCQKVILSL